MEAILSRHCSPIEALRRRIEGKIWSVTRTSTGHLIDLSTPHGDPGLFGPAAVCWQVHDDFPAMLVGGIRALMLQALHPLALAGVLEHSIYRQDMRGRLARTAQFVAGTTYGSVRDAHGLIVHVNGIHRGIAGVSADGHPYTATDPALLRWVHVAEVSSFLDAHLRNVNPQLAPADQDRYLAETATVARLLGATDVPETRAGAESVHPGTAWRTGGQPPPARSLLQLVTQAGANCAERLAMQIFVGAAIRLLPQWASAMVGESLTRFVHGWTEPAMRAACVVLRWSIRNSAAMRARARVASPQTIS